MSHQHFANQIQKTGFVLENRIAQQLKAERWTVISNRYYVDDAEESIREIDLVAYRASRIQHFDVYTTLIISCKKNEVNSWAFLARDIDLKDPNSDWQPLHAWSNDKALQYQLNAQATSARYHARVAQDGVAEALAIPSVEVFAFQEMNKTSGAPQNDKNIFAAVTSLMKAQAYELGALPQRKKTPAVYQFNLLSIVDTDLVRLMFSDDDITATPIDAEHYIARYIIRKKETFSRIRFLRADSFGSTLADYERLHEANCKWFEGECNAFYNGAVEDSKRVRTFIDDLRQNVAWRINWCLENSGQKRFDPNLLHMYWNKEKAELGIYGPFGSRGEEALNSDEKVRTHVADALKKIYRYEGVFTFEDDDIPF